MQSKQYRMGKLVELPTPKIQNPTKQEILRNFDFPQLHSDYNRFLGLIERHHSSHGISSEVETIIIKFCGKLVSFLYSYPLDNINIDNSMKQLVVRLQNDVDVAAAEYAGLARMQEIPWTVRKIIEYSFLGVEHFLNQFKLLINSYTPGQKIPSNPTDWERKNLFEREVEAHQKIYGKDKFPRHKVLEPIMVKYGFSFPERTYGDWRRQWKNGTFKNFVQDRKNRQ